MSLFEPEPSLHVARIPEHIAGLSPEAVVDAIEANLVDASAALGRTQDGVVFRGTDVTWIYSGFPALSRVLQARFTAEDALDRVQEIQSYFQKWDASVSWIVGPSSWPPALAGCLSKSGFSSNDTWLGMASDITAPLPDPAWPSGLRIASTVDAAALSAWAALGAEPITRERLDRSPAIFSPVNAGGDPRCKYYLGYLNGIPVARAMTFTRKDCVGLYWLSTQRQHQGKGIGAAMAHRALTDARAAGVRLAVMSTADTGRPLVRQLGFHTYCQFNIFSWPPPPSRLQFS
jgi:GNAT superfamily N-acetyltransferase